MRDAQLGYLIGGPWPMATDGYGVQEDYKTNEIAINWNGALIDALAGLVDPESFATSVAAAKRATSRGARTAPNIHDE